MYTSRLISALAISFLLVSGVQASLVTNEYSFSGSNWNPGWSPNTLTGDLTVTYDPTIDVTGGILGGINLVIGGHSFTTVETRFDFFAAPPAAGSDKLIVYGTPSGPSLGFSVWDIRLVIDQASTATPVLSQFSFTPNTSLQRASTLRSVTVSTVVPLPAAVWLFGSGLLGLVGMAWRKKA